MGEFRALVDVAERDRALCDTLKRVLKLSKASDGPGSWLRWPAGQCPATVQFLFKPVPQDSRVA